jgi:hypothetical protein
VLTFDYLFSGLEGSTSHVVVTPRSNRGVRSIFVEQGKIVSRSTPDQARLDASGRFETKKTKPPYFQYQHGVEKEDYYVCYTSLFVVSVL